MAETLATQGLKGVTSVLLSMYIVSNTLKTLKPLVRKASGCY